jgi:hypothetical protein
MGPRDDYDDRSGPSWGRWPNPLEWLVVLGGLAAFLLSIYVLADAALDP